MEARRSGLLLVLAAAIVGSLLTACVQSEEGDPEDLLAWEFPAESSGFARVSLRGGPESGEWIAGYNLEDPENPVIFTMFVYPAPGVASLTPGELDGGEDALASLEFGGSQESIVNRQPVGTTHLFDRSLSIVQRGEDQSGRMAAYEVPTPSAETLTSVLYPFRDGPWYIKYRVTYQTTSAAEAQEAVAELMSALVWP